MKAFFCLENLHSWDCVGKNDVYMNVGSQKIGLKLKKVNRDILAMSKWMQQLPTYGEPTMLGVVLCVGSGVQWMHQLPKKCNHMQE